MLGQRWNTKWHTHVMFLQPFQKQRASQGLLRLQSELFAIDHDEGHTGSNHRQSVVISSTFTLFFERSMPFNTVLITFCQYGGKGPIFIAVAYSMYSG